MLAQERALSQANHIKRPSLSREVNCHTNLAQLKIWIQEILQGWTFQCIRGKCFYFSVICGATPANYRKNKAQSSG
jgi:hypothetical protein